METLNRLPWAAQNSVFQRLAEIAEVSAMTKEERIKYDYALKQYRDTLNAMQGAELKGEARGRAEGRAEERQANARRMKAKGYSVDDISEITGLSVDEVMAL